VPHDVARKNRPRHCDDAVSAIDLRRRRHLCLIALLSLLTEQLVGSLSALAADSSGPDLPF
jgi:hypothetical protein